jgi:hypothetical protein
MFGLLALICIILGFVVAIFDANILFQPIIWFVAAIALNTLDLPLSSFAFPRRKAE